MLCSACEYRTSAPLPDGGERIRCRACRCLSDEHGFPENLERFFQLSLGSANWTSVPGRNLRQSTFADGNPPKLTRIRRFLREARDAIRSGSFVMRCLEQ